MLYTSIIQILIRVSNARYSTRVRLGHHSLAENLQSLNCLSSLSSLPCNVKIVNLGASRRPFAPIKLPSDLLITSTLFYLSYNVTKMTAVCFAKPSAVTRAQYQFREKQRKCTSYRRYISNNLLGIKKYFINS